VGNNEDAWSINARIRFENGRLGEYGAVYLCHYNGSPMREMIDLGGAMWSTSSFLRWCSCHFCSACFAFR